MPAADHGPGRGGRTAGARHQRRSAPTGRSPGHPTHEGGGMNPHTTGVGRTVAAHSVTTSATTQAMLSGAPAAYVSPTSSSRIRAGPPVPLSTPRRDSVGTTLDSPSE